MLDSYDMKFATHDSLKRELDISKQEMSLVQQNLGKDKVVTIVG